MQAGFHFTFRISSFELQLAALWWGLHHRAQACGWKDLMGVPWGACLNQTCGKGCVATRRPSEEWWAGEEHELSLKVSSACDLDREGSGWKEGGQSTEAPGCHKAGRRTAWGRQLSKKMEMHKGLEREESGPDMEVRLREALGGGLWPQLEGRMGWRRGEAPPEAFPLHLKGALCSLQAPTETSFLMGRLGGKACRPAPWTASRVGAEFAQRD